MTNLTFLGNPPTFGSDAFTQTGYTDNQLNFHPATVYYYAGTTGWGTSYGGMPAVLINTQPPQVNYAIAGNTAYVASSSNAPGNIVILSTYQGYPVTSISANAFQNDTSLTNITVPSGLTNIGASAFSGCTNLTNLTFPGNAPALGAGAFASVPAGAVIYYYYGASGWGATYGGLSTMMLGSPAPKISKNNIGLQSGNFAFAVSGVTSQTLIVEASTNFTNWQAVWTNVLSGTNATFSDPQWTNYSRRAYRVRSQ
jgi:hypothetical protein